MQRLKDSILPVVKPRIGIPYVDDTFVIVKKDELVNTYNLVHNVFDDINLTMEKQSNNKLLFSDVLINEINKRKLAIQVYLKQTHTDRILTYSDSKAKTQLHKNLTQEHKKTLQHT